MFISASMQDLRGSELVGGNFNKNNEVFATDWDLIIVDGSAHQGTQTEPEKAGYGRAGQGTYQSIAPVRYSIQPAG